MKQRIKKIWQDSGHYRLLLLTIVLSVNVFLLSRELTLATKSDQYFVAHEDEVIYFGSGKVFAATASVRAESCIAEDVSPVGQLNWYGPGYSVIYGTLRLLFGDALSLTIKFHFVLALLAIAVTLLIPGEREGNLIAANAFFTTTQFSAFIFSYFPETCHFFMATVLSGLLIIIYMQPNQGKIVSRLFLIYAGLCLVFMLCRITMIFWLVGLIPLATNRKQLIALTTFFLAGVLAALIYMKLFIAPAYAGDMHKINELYKLNLWSFFVQTIKGFVTQFRILIYNSSLSSYLVLMLIAAAAGLYFIKQSRTLLAALLIATTLVVVLLCYYTASPFFFVKQTSMLIPLLLLVVIRECPVYFRYFLFLPLLFLVPRTLEERSASIGEHKAAFENKTAHAEFESALQSLPTYIDKHGSIVILWSYSEYDYGNAAQALLPYATQRGKPIMYTTNIVFDSNAPAEERFRLHHKLSVDYLLSRHPLSWPNLRLVMQCPYYFFYEIKQ